MSTQINMVAASQRSRPVIVGITPEMSGQINMAASHGSAVSTIPSELVAVKAILEVHKPQRLRRIFASLCYLLAYNTDPQDYYFTVDPVDRPNLAGRGLEKFERLINTSTNSGIRLDFIPETGKMTAMTMSTSLRCALHGVVHASIGRNIAGVPGLKWWHPEIATLQYVCAVKYNDEPYALVLFANSGNGTEADKFVRSVLAVVTRNYPSLKMIVQLQMRGLDRKIHKDNVDIEDRVRRISEQSRIEVWSRKGAKFDKDDTFSATSLPGDGELRLPLPNDAQIKTVPVLQFSGILQTIREHCEEGSLMLSHPDNQDSQVPNDDNKGLRASVFPLDALKPGFAAGIARLLAPRAREDKAGGVGSKAPFSSMSGGATLAVRRGMLPPTGTAGLGLIKTGGSTRRIHSTAGNTATRLLSARHLGRLLRR